MSSPQKIDVEKITKEANEIQNIEMAKVQPEINRLYRNCIEDIKSEIYKKYPSVIVHEQKIPYAIDGVQLLLEFKNVERL